MRNTAPAERVKLTRIRLAKVKEDLERKNYHQQRQQKFNEEFRSRQHYACYEDYLRSNEWQEKRAAIIQRASGKCEKPECNRALTEVHHIWYPKTWGNEPPSALVGLCHEHHEAEHQVRF